MQLRENKKKYTPIGDASFVEGVKACIPTLLGYLSIGFAAGVVQKTAGLSLVEVALISLIVYAGSAQFIMASMLIANSSIAAMIVTVFFINLRHLLLSAALSPFFKHLTPFKNMLIGALLTDETFGVAIHETASKQRLSEKWMHGLNITAYLNWLAANLAGAYFSQWIADPQKFGLDYALAAMFIGLLVLAILARQKIKKDLLVALCAIITIVIFSTFTSSSFGIIAATLAASTFGMVIDKWK